MLKSELTFTNKIISVSKLVISIISDGFNRRNNDS